MVWVATLTYDADPTGDEMNRWAEQLEHLDGSVARVPRVPYNDVDAATITMYIDGEANADRALRGARSAADGVVGSVRLLSAEVVDEALYMRRAEAPTLPRLVSSQEIAEMLSVSRQRVSQLRSNPAFPAPLLELRTGPIWNASAVEKFARNWTRKPGRPKSYTPDLLLHDINESSGSTLRQDRTAYDASVGLVGIIGVLHSRGGAGGDTVSAGLHHALRAATPASETALVNLQENIEETPGAAQALWSDRMYWPERLTVVNCPVMIGHNQMLESVVAAARVLVFVTSVAVPPHLANDDRLVVVVNSTSVLANTPPGEQESELHIPFDAQLHRSGAPDYTRLADKTRRAFDHIANTVVDRLKQ